MQNLQDILKSYGNRDLQERKTWYSPAASAYNKARPRYPQALIDRVVEVAQLSSESKILEVGSGPAIATIPFAQLGCSMVCLEPNPDFVLLAKENCQAYPNVKIQNTSFEEWRLESSKFDAVLAASSFHWISPEVACSKAFSALKEDGYLILLWNNEPRPSYEVYQDLFQVYQVHAPSLARYEDRETQEAIFKSLGQIMMDSGYFKDLIFDQVETEVTYSVDDYLTLLCTYSPYLKLEPQNRDALFTGLREKIEQNYGGSLQLSYISAFHIASPKNVN